MLATTALSMAMAMILAMAVSVHATAFTHPSLVRRHEQYQPDVTDEFPNLVGIPRLRSWMDKDATEQLACSDFYQYTCGGFETKYKSFGSIDVLSLMQKANSMLMESILNQTEDALAESRADKIIFDKVRTYYRSCTNTAAIAERGLWPLKPLAERIVRLCEDGTQQSHRRRPALLGNLQASGVYSFFRSTYSKVQSADPRDLRLQFIPAPAFDVHKSVIFDVLLDFVGLGVIDTSLDLYGLSEWIWEVEQDSIEFISSLNLCVYAQKTNSGEHSMVDRENQFISINMLEDATDMDWHSYLKPLHLDGLRDVFLWSSADPWIRRFRQIAEYPTNKLKYYVLWRLAVAHYPKLSPQYTNIWKTKMKKNMVEPDIKDVMDGVNDFQKDCITETGFHLNYLSGHLFVQYALNSTQKQVATNLIDELFDAFRHRLERIDWMDDRTRDAAIDKLDNIVRVVGYPDWLADADLVSRYYDSLEFKEDTYFENAVSAQVFTDLIPSINQFRDKELIRQNMYLGYPWMLNAFHLIDLVQIQINSGLLQRPLFSSSNPSAMNYGSVGAIIGHEITH
eukprot:jgi/Hompol1/6175/HPOL_002183-RA